jgi:PAS domain S-box-containing protein
MEKHIFLQQSSLSELKEKINNVSSENNIEELKNLIQKLSVHLGTLVQENQQLLATQTELNVLKEKYAGLFNDAPVGYLILDSSLIIQEVNKTASTQLGLSPGALAGNSFKELVDEAYHKIFESCFKEFIADNLSSECDLKLKTRDTEFFARLIVSANVTGEEPENFRIAVIDISKEKELEDRLIGESRKARENERLKSAFMANMSHEIRTPMNGILGFSELLQEPDLPVENLQEYVNIIQKSGKRMVSLIDELVGISKIETGAVRPVMVQTNINELLNYVYEFFLPDAQKKGLDLICEIPEKDGAIVLKTDKEKLHAILINLLKNAINYTSEGGVKFGCSLNNAWFRFYVSDTGSGIAESDREKIFDRFYRAENGENQTSGIGLGLPISRAFVEMLGGKISVESEPGKGSTFYFALPISETDETSGADNRLENIRDPEDLLNHLTILIAEDDEPARMYLFELLKKRCKEIHFAKNGKEAVEMYPDIKPHLVLMDIKMPVMDGYSAAIKIKGMDENAVIIAQTAYALAGDREKALAAGCSDYLAKPLRKEDVLNMIRKHLMS